MFKKLLRTVLSVVLAVSILMLPDSVVFAQTAAANTKASTDTAATEDRAMADQPVTAPDFTEAKKLAADKAAMLTNLYGVTSVQYALIYRGNIVLSGQAGVYSKDSGIPLTDTNMYGIGSISKMFTAAAVMQLVQEGKVNLDTPVTAYIPEFTMADPRYKEITIRMLLNHSSGLMGSTLGNSLLFNDADFTTYNNFLNSLKTSRLKADPGKFSVYCNDGFTLAEVVVEKVTGLSFTEYIKKNISEPLNLYNTKTPLDNFQKDRLVKTYMPGSSVTLPTESVNMIGAGGIYSSAINLCQFAVMFMEDSGSSLLNSTTRKTMENKEYLNRLWTADKAARFTYGLGWDSVFTYPFSEYGIKALSKSGDTDFYHGNLTVLPEENMAIAVLSSGGSSLYDLVMGQEILLSALKSKGSIQDIRPDKTFTKPTPASMPDKEKQYAGIYGNTIGAYKLAINDDGTLIFTNLLAPSSDAQKFVYTGDGKFYYIDGSTYISFEEKDGKTYLYVSGYTTLPGLGQTITEEYQAQRFTDNPISQEVKSVWDKRDGKKYFLLNEKYTSESYSISTPYSQIMLADDAKGYALNAAITDENTAKTNIEVPGLWGRDLSDYVFYKDGNTEYLIIGGYQFISEDGITSLPGTAFQVDIGRNKYAQWFKIGKESTNKKIKVTLPENAAFIVYDENDTCIVDSVITGQDTVTLPKAGYIVFAGDVNAGFSVKYVK